MQSTIAQQLGNVQNPSIGSAGCGAAVDIIPYFRRRESRDDDGIFALFSEEQFLHFAAARDPFASSDALREWLDNLNAANRFEIVAEEEDKVLGFAGLYVLGDGFGHSGWLMLGVLESAQRNGIGSGLLRILVKTAHLFIGLRRLQLTVFCDNEAAIRLYRKFGFKIEGRHRSYARRGSEFIDAFTMALIFDGASPNFDADSLRQMALG